MSAEVFGVSGDSAGAHMICVGIFVATAIIASAISRQLFRRKSARPSNLIAVTVGWMLAAAVGWCAMRGLSIDREHRADTYARATVMAAAIWWICTILLSLGVAASLARRDSSGSRRVLLLVLPWLALFTCALALATLPILRWSFRMDARIRSMSNIRQISIGVFGYAQDHEDLFPDTLDEVAQYIRLDSIMMNPRNGEKPGYIYVRPAKGRGFLQHPSEKPMVFEVSKGTKDENSAVGFADGHVVFDHADVDPAPGLSPISDRLLESRYYR